MSTSIKKLEIILAILGLLLAFLAWRFPYVPPGPATEHGESSTVKDHLQHSDNLTDKSEETQPATESLQRNLSARESWREPHPSSSTPLPTPEFPAELTLRDGQQSVLLAGRASVGIQFNQLGSERFLTLHINAEDGARAHAILGTGARFPFRVAGVTYQVALLAADYDEKTVQIRIDRTN